MKIKDQKKVKLITKIVVIIIILLIIIVIISKKGTKGYELSSQNKETEAYTNLRISIADGRICGSGILSNQYMIILGQIVKNMDNSNKWFENNMETFYGGMSDNLDYEITWISDGTHCATFMIKKEGNKYYLCNYSFIEDNKIGTKVLIK